jgi:hypothetical protein
MNDSFYQLLLKAKESESPVALYCNVESPRAFLAGWIEAVSSEHVVLRHLSPEGRYDGYVLKYLESIFRIDTEGRYIERLSYLFNARHQNFPARLIGEHDESSNLIVEILHGAAREEMMATIEIAAEDVENGLVKEVGFEAMTLEVYDHYGAIDREASIHLEAISEVRVDSERLQSLKLLSNWTHLPGLE